MSTMQLQDVEPKEVFSYFQRLTEIPRGSGDEQKVSDYLVDFAKEHHLEYIQDKAYNVLIKKPASPGYENRPIVIMQGHMDMVCEKNSDTVHDFTKDPIHVVIEGDKITAKGTTLGADDGMGVAFMLAILADPSLEHPAIEAVFTSDEERGMTGVEEFDASVLKGRILINLDSDDEGVFVVGCAGGPVVEVNLPIKWETPDTALVPIQIEVRGLKGGHSGEDIHRGRANSIKLLSRILVAIEKISPKMQLASVSGGLKYNAIPREADAVVLVEKEKADTVIKSIEEFNSIFHAEYRLPDPGIDVTGVLAAEKPEQVFSKESKTKIIDYLFLSETGIIKMNAELEGVVESSVSLGVVTTRQKDVQFQVMTRSSTRSSYKDMFYKIERLAANVGAELIVKSDCPEWEYNPDSKIKNLFETVYRDMFGKESKMLVLHAGLECGVFAQKISEPMDMISAGPDIRDLHTPGEYVTISSTQKVWEFLKEVLKKIS